MVPTFEAAFSVVSEFGVRFVCRSYQVRGLAAICPTLTVVSGRARV